MRGDAAKLMAAAVSVLIAASGDIRGANHEGGRHRGPNAWSCPGDGEARRGQEGRSHSRAVARNPDPDIRNEARFRHSRILRGEKRYREAAVLLRRLLDEKPKAGPARLELAVVLQLLGDTNSALRELRAVQSAGLPPAVARLIDRYSQALRAQRPLGGSIEVSLAPDSNINRATRSDTLGTIFGDFQIAQEGKRNPAWVFRSTRRPFGACPSERATACWFGAPAPRIFIGPAGSTILLWTWPRAPSCRLAGTASRWRSERLSDGMGRGPISDRPASRAYGLTRSGREPCSA